MSEMHRTLRVLTAGFLCLAMFAPLHADTDTNADVDTDTEEDKPVVIAISPFLDFSGYDSAAIMSLRGKVTANLMQNYNCTILSRSHGITFSFERKVDALSRLNQKAANSKILPAADYSLVGYFKIARKTPGEKNQIDLGCTLLITDLEKRDEEDFRKIEFIPDHETLYAEDVTNEIVKALNLKPRQVEKESQQGKIDETWAVLPIKRLENKKAMKAPADRGLATTMELALQKTGKLTAIVDRSKIDEALEELKIRSIGGATEKAAGRVARLVGADKIIMGSVSQVKRKNSNLRLDIFLVDGKEAVITGSATAVCQKSELKEKASELARRFIKKEHPLPDLVAATPGLLNQEAKVYLELLSSLKYVMFAKRGLTEFAIPLLETIYLLAGDDQTILYEAGKTVLFDLTDNENRQAKKRELVLLGDKFFRKVEHSEYTDTILILRARLLKEIPDKIDKALSLARKHLNEHPQVNPKYTRAVIAECYYEKKEYRKALKWAEQAEYNRGAVRLRTKLYPLVDDSENDRRELDDLILLDDEIRNQLHGDRLVRKLRLLSRLEGAEEALEYSRKIGAWASARPEVQLEIAKINIALGNRENAATILAGLDSKKSMKQSGYENRKKRKELVQDIRQTREKLGDVAATPKKLAEFYDIPDKYTLYVIPAGNPNMEMINNAIPAAEEFLGCNVEVLPRVPLPEDPACFKKSRGQYKVEPVLQRLRYSYEIPKNAIGVGVITDKDIFTGKYRFVFASTAFGLRLVSYQRWHGAGDQAVLTDMLAKSIATVFLSNADLHGCQVNSCMSSSTGSAWGNKYKDFSLCRLCQKKLEKHPAEWVYKRFRERYDDSTRYLKNDEDERKRMHEYKNIVRRHRKQAEQKQENGKSEGE